MATKFRIFGSEFRIYDWKRERGSRCLPKEGTLEWQRRGGERKEQGARFDEWVLLGV